MKKILFRKLLLDYLTFFLIALISTGTVIWVFQAVNFLDIMIEDGRDYLVYLKFSLLNYPKILSKIFPFILFFSLYYVTIKYEQNNELIIFWNFGVNKLDIINLILRVSLILMILQIFLNSYVVPYSQDLARSFLRTSTVNFYDNFVKPKKFNDTIKGLTIYADRKDEDGKLDNLYLKKQIKKNEFQITYAKKGEFKEVGSKPVLVLYEGATITSKENKITNISFSQSDFSLANMETNTTTYKKTQEIDSIKLIKCINNFYKFDKEKFELKSRSIENCTLQNIQNIFKEVYKRFIIPFYIPLLSMVPFLLIIISKENLNYQKLKFFTFLIGFFLIIFSETTIRFISRAEIQNILLFSIPIVLLILMYIFLSNKIKTNFKSS